MTITTTTLREAADRLIAAAAAPRQCDPVRDILGDTDIASAYAVQRLLTEDSVARGRRIVGHKIGLTSPAVQRQLGVDQPDSGVLFADMRVATGATVASGNAAAAQGRGRDRLRPRRGPRRRPSESRIRAAAGVAVPAIEIVDSRVRDWSISIVDTIADNGSSALFVLGSETVAAADLDFVSRTMRLTQDGVVVSDRAGFGLPGQPAQRAAVACPHRSATTALRCGPATSCSPVRSVPMVPVRPGSTYVGRDRRNRFGRGRLSRR